MCHLQRRLGSGVLAGGGIQLHFGRHAFRVKTRRTLIVDLCFIEHGLGLLQLTGHVGGVDGEQRLPGLDLVPGLRRDTQHITRQPRSDLGMTLGDHSTRYLCIDRHVHGRHRQGPGFDRGGSIRDALYTVRVTTSCQHHPQQRCRER
jgi:hypothetical protein